MRSQRSYMERKSAGPCVEKVFLLLASSISESHVVQTECNSPGIAISAYPQPVVIEDPATRADAASFPETAPWHATAERRLQQRARREQRLRRHERQRTRRRQPARQRLDAAISVRSGAGRVAAPRQQRQVWPGAVPPRGRFKPYRQGVIRTASSYSHAQRCLAVGQPTRSLPLLRTCAVTLSWAQEAKDVPAASAYMLRNVRACRCAARWSVACSWGSSGRGAQLDAKSSLLAGQH